MVHAVVLGVEIGVGVGARAAEPGPRAFVSSSETRFRSGDEVLGTVEDVPVAVREWGEKVVTTDYAQKKIEVVFHYKQRCLRKQIRYM